MINAIFAAWVAFFGFRGYRRGGLVILLGLVGFVLAYVVCFWGVQPLAHIFKRWGMGQMLAFSLAATLLFSGVTVCVSVLPRVALSRLGVITPKQQSISGALLGLASGIVSGLLLVWAFGFVKASLDLKMESEGIEVSAKRIVGAVAEYGVDISSEEGVKAELTKALFKDPEDFVGALNALAKSAELHAFINNIRVQNFMANNDVEGLLHEPKFVALVEHQSVAGLLDELDDAESAKREFASGVTGVWRKMQALKHDPEIQAILQDAEVKQLIDDKNPLALLANEKIRLIVDRVMDADADKIDYAVLKEIVDKQERQQDKTSTHQLKPQSDIYEWRDDLGNVQFSDYQSVPVDKRDSAKRVGGM